MGTEDGRGEVRHTPTPWHAWDRGIGYEIHRGDASACDGRCLEINMQMKDTFKQEDAEFIVLAVNNHDALLSALKELVQTDTDQSDPGLQIIALEKARAAIAGAEKGE